MLSDNAYHHHDAQQCQPAGFHTAPLVKATLGIKILNLKLILILKYQSTLNVVASIVQDGCRERYGARDVFFGFGFMISHQRSSPHDQYQYTVIQFPQIRIPLISHKFSLNIAFKPVVREAIGISTRLLQERPFTLGVTVPKNGLKCRFPEPLDGTSRAR